jgi:LmbE family N-acetylglucosaminyl deacetylase
MKAFQHIKYAKSINVWTPPADLYNITETIEVKISALRAHKSQMGDWDPGESIKSWAAERAKGKEMTYAESYRVVTLMDDEAWEKYMAKNRPG